MDGAALERVENDAICGAILKWARQRFKGDWTPKSMRNAKVHLRGKPLLAGSRAVPFSRPGGWKRTGFEIGLLLTLLALSQYGWSQLAKPAASSQPAQAQPAEALQDPLGRTTPRGTVLGFLTAAYAQKYDTAAQYMDTSARPKDAAILAKQLLFVLDRKLPAKLNNVSNDPLGSLSNPLNSRRELIGSVVTDSGGSDIYLDRIDRPNGVPIWLFSRETLAEIPDVYDEINETSVTSLLPDVFLTKYFGVTLFAWTFFLVFLPLLYLALSVTNRLVSVAAGYALRHWWHQAEARNPTILPHPIRLLVISATVYGSLSRVSLSLFARQVGNTIATLILIVALIWTMFLVNARCELHLKKRMEARGRLSSTAVLRPARRVMDLLAIVIGLMFLLHSLGINPSAALAGLGVGGIAIALAAQKTLENAIGGASLIMDGVVRVGDFFKVGDVSGTIEAIGLRSTRVRTLDRTIVTIPNGQMATMMLENYSARDQFWLRHLIGVKHQTPPAALNTLIANVRALLEQDSRVLPASIRVRFLRFAESNLELEIYAYVSARNWDHFLEIQQDVLIRIRELIGSAGVELGYPARTVYLKNEPGIDGTLSPLPPMSVGAKEAVHETQIHQRV